jgi:hypothetical protein
MEAVSPLGWIIVKKGHAIQPRAAHAMEIADQRGAALARANNRDGNILGNDFKSPGPRSAPPFVTQAQCKP